ncbi:MAG: asparagine synthase (glutamine-hydrolyzing) [Candidatus Omnitrophota bacterium]|nr:MAG: asparagine synthase (glutamine-hydrolyzing) [Candidatus Omnitrophota bacterium]
MCGICGFVKNNGRIAPGIVEKMLMPMKHRGPDDEGIFKDDTSPFSALGHCRLSIIDLEAGHQPMSDDSNRYVCVHNGEIYNFLDLRESLEKKGYKFRTKSDAEVIANMYHAHDKECVEKFNGMFAFAIWDKKEKVLFVCRDRIGIKPLYYYFDGNNFIFSSNLKSFLALDFVKKEIDHEALTEYLQYLYINAPRSIFKEIKKLEPGSSILLKNGKIAVERYWNIEDIVSDKKPALINDEKICINEIKFLLRDSIKKRLISDVPLGIFLSGGVDSSIITALAAKYLTGKIRTFNIAFKGKGYYDESRFAKRVSRLFGTEHKELEVSPDLRMDLSEIVDFLDEPFADSSFVSAYYLSKFTREHVKVALSGTGGDDVFAGYRRYALNKAIDIFDRGPDFVKKGFSFITNSIFPTRKNYIGEKALLARRFFSVLNIEKDKRHDKLMSFISRDMQKELLSTSAINTDTSTMLAQVSNRFMDQPYVNKALYTDFLSYLAGDLLTKEDRATMAVGLEGRVPFLDHRLVEYSFQIDPELKVKGLSTKYILKRAFEDILPKDLLHREKHGFAFPISEYLRGELKDTAKEILFSDIHRFFNQNTLEDLFNRHLDRKEDLGQHIWALLVFNLWYEKNMS